MGRKLTTGDFIEKARKIHGDKYDYSKVNYVNSRTNICIICPKHGEFWQRPDLHLDKHGCPLCGFENTAGYNRLNTDEFIKKAREIHGDKYDYSKVVYKDSKTKVCIICPEHGEFWQKPNDHLSRKFGCHKCGWIKEGLNLRKKQEDFIKEAKEKFGDKYDYSKVNYINNATKVCIISHEKDIFGVEIGEFWQTPANHLSYGISNTMLPPSTERFIKRAKSIHGDFYNYDKTELKNYKENVIITCPIHGDFYQFPFDHLRGSDCPKCRNVSVLEKITRNVLKELNIEFIEQKRFPFLGRLSLDFYIPSLKIGLECQGKQHFINNNFWGGFEDIVQRDKTKKEICEKNGIKIFYLINKKYTNINEEIYNDNNTFNIKQLKTLIENLRENK